MNGPQQTDLVFQALASRPRRIMMDLVRQMPGCSVNDVCQHFDMSRIGVMKHLDMLVQARLVISRKQGRTRQLFFNAVPIQLIYDRWTDEYSAFWATQAVDLKYQSEQTDRGGTAGPRKKNSPARVAGKKSTRPNSPAKKSTRKRKVAR